MTDQPATPHTHVTTDPPAADDPGAATVVHLRTDRQSRGRVVIDRTSDVVRIRLSVAAGHLPPGERADLVEAVFALPQLSGPQDAGPRRVEATIPLGDADLLWHLRTHVDVTSTRSAGATCLVDGTCRPPRSA